MHKELIPEIQEALDNSFPDKIVKAAPRGNAKSTIVSFVTVIWCAVYRKKKYILLISDTSSQANDFLLAIKQEFEDNDLLVGDFGSMQGLIWTNSDIILSNGIRIQAFGAGKKIRGRRHMQYRPDLVIGDDLENDENVESVDQRKKMFSWWTKAVSKAGDERTDFIVIGTIIHSDSLLAKLLKNPVYKAKKYQAIIKWSTSPLWDEWERILVNLGNTNAITDAEVFYKEHEAEMLEGTEVLWPEKEPYYNLMLQLISDGPASFSSEKQNEPLADEDRRFHPDWIKYYDQSELMGKHMFVVGYCDPSLGKKGGDMSAIISLGMDDNGQVYVLDADLGKRHPDVIIETVVVKHEIFHYDVFGTEEVAFQEYFEDSLKKRMEEITRKDNRMALTIRGIKVHSDKILRIESLQPDVKSGRIKFRRDQQNLIQQLVNFPLADYDDGPDALEGAMRLLGRRSAVAEYYKNVANESKRQNIQSFLQNPTLTKI